MRGKVKIPVVVGYKNRITPAYAGKSVGACFKAGKHEDHPRLCGEKLLSAVTSATTRGSPPPMRGKAAKRPPFVQLMRIPPAYAGKRK